MNVGILCDGGEKVGAGHFFRCLSIGYELQRLTIDIDYYLSTPDLVPFAEKTGVRFSVIEGIFDDDDLNECLLIELEEKHTSCVIIDSHRAREVLLRGLRSIYYTVYFDDMMMFPYPVDLLINAHIDVNIEDYRTLYHESNEGSIIFLLGVNYFALRGDYRKKRGISDEKSDIVSFFAGGSDPEHITLKLMRYLSENNIRLEYELFVVVGLMNCDYAEIMDISVGLSGIKVYYGLTDLSKIYTLSTYAISAAGITLYELAYYGVPTVSYSVVDNQVHTSHVFDIMGVSIDVGDVREDDCIIDRMLMTVDSLRDNKELTKLMRKKAIGLMDGKGACRIASIISKKGGRKNEVL